MLTTDWLKKNHQLIHYFGLGFIQVKINDTVRVHFYHKDLPSITPEEDIHNHRYDFISTILLGSLHQEIFKITEGDTHVKEFVSCDKEKEINPSPSPCGIQSLFSGIHTSGSIYQVTTDVFHRVKSDYCITKIVREKPKMEFAEVVRPNNSVAICPFSKTVELAKLWEIVDNMIKQVDQ